MRVLSTRRGLLALFSAGNLLCLVLLLSGGDASWRSVLAAGTGQRESLDIEQMAEKDLYAVLELPPGAPAADVKAAYRKLARLWHPDKNPADTKTAQSKFAQIAEAYEILSDDSTRELYDHARRVRAAAGRYHQQQHNHGDGGADFAGGVFDDGDWRQDEWASAQWYQDYVDAMGMGDGLFFGSSFGTGGGGGGFDAGFEQGPFGVGGEGAWGGGHGVRFEFRPRDPMELFDALFGVSGYDGYDEMDNYLHMQDQQRQQQQEVEEMRRQFEEQRGREEGVRYPDDMFAGESFFDHSGDRRFTIGQEFEQYHDFEAGGRMFRRVITTTEKIPGKMQSTARDFVFDEENRRWLEAGRPSTYAGPGVGHGSDGPVDNVLRMNEILKVHESITTVDRKFTATLDSTCNLVVNTYRGAGKNRSTVQVWETGSFDPTGRCFVMIQDNGMLVIMKGEGPSTAGNVLWSNNRAALVGWLRPTSFHASLMPNGNLVVAQGDSPMHALASKCLMGAFGCPGSGGVQEWKLVWISFRTQAQEIWCKVVNHWSGEEEDLYTYFTGMGKGDKNEQHYWHKETTKAKKSAPAEAIEAGAEAYKHLAEKGKSTVKDAWEKVKTAAEETAYAASRPRHW